MGNTSSTISNYEERIRILEKRVLELEQTVFLDLDNSVNYLTNNQPKYVHQSHTPTLMLKNPDTIDSV